MRTERLNFRVNPVTKRRLQYLAQSLELTLSETLDELINQAYFDASGRDFVSEPITTKSTVNNEQQH